MNLKIPISLLLIFIVTWSSAQDKSKNIDLKIGVARYNSIPAVSSKKTTPNLNVDVDVSISEFLKTGVYFGASVLKNIDTSSLVVKSLAIYYGVNFSVDLLKLVVKDRNLRPDIYAITKIGGRSVPAPEDYLFKGNDFIWACGLGVSYRFNKRIGAFVEGTYGNNIFKIVDKWSIYGLDPKYAIDFRYGIVLKF
ncbi:MAG: hypothetical protein R6W78_05690 [Bacteroidales bacterium]